MSRKPAVRRRGAALEQAILDAVWEELQEVGFSRLTMDGVAKRAGTSKPVLYRRWADRTELIIAAAASRMPTVDSIPDSGSLRGDAITLLRQLRDRMSQVAPLVVVTLVGEATQYPTFRREFLHRFLDRLNTLMNETVIDRAIERGEITEAQLTDRLRRLPIDLTRNEFLITGVVSDEAIEEIIDQAFLPALQGRRSAADAAPAPAPAASTGPQGGRSDREGVTGATAGDGDADAGRDLV
jgi:AcrR family transcriptional regulator